MKKILFIFMITLLTISLTGLNSLCFALSDYRELPTETYKGSKVQQVDLGIKYPPAFNGGKLSDLTEGKVNREMIEQWQQQKPDTRYLPYSSQIDTADEWYQDGKSVYLFIYEYVYNALTSDDDDNESHMVVEFVSHEGLQDNCYLYIYQSNIRLDTNYFRMVNAEDGGDSSEPPINHIRIAANFGSWSIHQYHDSSVSVPGIYSNHKVYVSGIYEYVPDYIPLPNSGKYPYGGDPLPLTDEIIYPMQIRDWNYLRQFGVNALPSYNDMALLVKNFPDSRTLDNGIEMVGRMHYVILRNKQTGNYQVHLMGREFRAEDGQAAGVTLNWKPPILWGLFGGYYQAKGNPWEVAGTYHSFVWLSPEHSYEINNPRLKDGGWLPYKVPNTYDVIEFGVFVGDTGQSPPDVVNPPSDGDLPPEYDPEYNPKDPLDDGMLTYLFVPSSLDYLPLFQSLGKIAEPVEGVVQIFSDIAEFTPTYNLPPAVIMDTDVSPHIQQVFEIPVSNFLGQEVTVIQGIRLLSSCYLGFIILKSLWRYGLKIFGGGEE